MHYNAVRRISDSEEGCAIYERQNSHNAVLELSDIERYIIEQTKIKDIIVIRNTLLKYNNDIDQTIQAICAINNNKQIKVMSNKQRKKLAKQERKQMRNKKHIKDENNIVSKVESELIDTIGSLSI